MTPGARVAAAIEVLGDMAQGLAAEQALTRWARRSRFAGSKDRAAIRDHVFDVLRQRRCAAHFGRDDTPRALMIGSLHAQGADLATLFTGQGHAPSPLTQAEQDFPPPPTDKGVLWNLPDWLLPLFEAALGAGAAQTALALTARAPITLRVNLAKTSRADARAALDGAGVATRDNPLCDTALTVTDGARRIRNSPAYQSGLVELQDAASQAVVAAMPRGARTLDFCAGGGGKALALAARGAGSVFAHDIDLRRMADLPDRAKRAGADITLLRPETLHQAGLFDVVLCDAPCTGSGAWRRAAEGKWTLTPERLMELNGIQDAILDQAMTCLAPGGTLVYATCSVLHAENEDRIAGFLARHPDWKCLYQQRYDVSAEGDGFFAAHLMRD